MEDLLIEVKFALELTDELEKEVRIVREELDSVLNLIYDSKNASEVEHEMPYGLDVSWELYEVLNKLDEVQNTFNRMLRG